MADTVENPRKPTKGVRPELSGVPGELVSSAPEGLLFGERKVKTSPYDPLLIQLKAAGAGKFLRFGDLRCRVSLTARAKKLGIRILFGEHGSDLYVSLAKADLVNDGATEPQPKNPTVPALILAALAIKGRNTPGLITTWLRSNGHPRATIEEVDTILGNLARERKVSLKSPGDLSSAPTWRLVS